MSNKSYYKEKTKDEFIKKSIEKHGDKYDYNNINYINTTTKIDILCKIHNEYFSQQPIHHERGTGCPKCSHSYKKDLNDFILKSNLIHNNRYDYSNFKYVNSKTKSEIICEKHGTFYQSPNSHSRNKNYSGCPKCMISKGENHISILLQKLNINFEIQKMFNDCIYKRPLPFDFYLTDYNSLIEFDGHLHFMSVEHFGGDDSLRITKIRDEIKNKYCEANNIPLLRIKYDEIDSIEEKIIKFINDIYYRKH